MSHHTSANVQDKRLILLTAAILLAIQIELLFAKSINWDELFHFSQIHASARGEYVQWLQTPYVQLFGWVTSVPGSPIDHILLIRLLLLPCGILTGLIIFDITRRFTNQNSAAIAALAVMGSGYVFEHSFALRADMIAATLCMAALWIVATRKIRPLWIFAFVILCILAFVSTIKSVLYAPAFVALIFWRFKDHERRNVFLLICGALVLIAFAGFSVMSAAISGPITTLAKSSAARMFDAGLFPQTHFIAVQLAMAPIVTAAMLLAITRRPQGTTQITWWLGIGLMMPLASIIIYRNSFPYFYAFIMPPVAVGAALGFAALHDQFGLKKILLVIVANAAVISFIQDRDVIGRQRDVSSGIHQIFGGPTRYIDDVAFRPDYPRAVAQFASGWALEGYRAAGKPIYRQAIMANSVPFLFRQGYALENISPDPVDAMALLPDDAATLEQHYIQHWGRVFVAGHRFAPNAQPQDAEILTPGTYTIEQGPLAVDGQNYLVGEVLSLGRGMHRIGPVGAAGSTLRWGDGVPVPDRPFPKGPLFTNY